MKTLATIDTVTGALCSLFAVGALAFGDLSGGECCAAALVIAIVYAARLIFIDAVAGKK